MQSKFPQVFGKPVPIIKTFHDVKRKAAQLIAGGNRSVDLQRILLLKQVGDVTSPRMLQRLGQTTLWQRACSEPVPLSPHPRQDSQCLAGTPAAGAWHMEAPFQAYY
ncbi:unnamed protein product, partial [Iphiclides podalirius]